MDLDIALALILVVWMMLPCMLPSGADVRAGRQGKPARRRL